MERVRGAGTVLVVLVVLGAPPAAGEELSGVFEDMAKHECHFINGTERVRFVERLIYNRQQYMHFDSDVGVYVGDTPYGEFQARYWNRIQERLDYFRAQVDTFCRHNYKVFTPFSVERRVPPSVSILLVPSSSQPGPGRLLCSVMDFYPAPVQVRWFQDGQELPEHVVATDVVPNGDWTYQVLVMLEIPPRRGVTSPCQVEHVSLEHPLSQQWEMPQDIVCSKILVGVGGFVLGLVFLVLGLGFYLREKRLSRRRLQPLPVASGPAGIPQSIPTQSSSYSTSFQNAKNYQTDLRTKKNQGDLRVKKNQMDLKAKKDWVDLRAKKNWGDLGTKKNERDLRTRKNRVDLRTKRNQTNLRAKENRGALRAKKNGTDVRVKKKQVELKDKTKQVDMRAKRNREI
ncbi:class II histocompatibility antigen, B-L beta chain-like [Myiozetetes cayanensis]|uniref:class II histocompatibility antigen, B-L beta chain-like n=1 Tax=Myiozetetes cayanensis TaxID=478635 RepID=UPI002160594D|nr:class II histocompatibility antigen, B-L beta chain-like [Myiozetetes cayanensis]